MSNRVRPRITSKEAFCRCGCGVKPSDGWLDTVNLYLVMYGKPMRISTIYRCDKYNAKIGGVKDSPHRYKTKDYGGADYRCRSPIIRMKLVIIAIAFYLIGKINQIEICNYHIHIAKVPKSHRLAGLCNWGKSR